MAGWEDKIKGKGNEIKGKAKKEYGGHTDDSDTYAEGEKDELKGKGQQVMGKAKDKAEDVKDKIKD